MVKRLARLNDGRWKSWLGVREREDQGVFGRGLRSICGFQRVLIYEDESGNEYEDPDEPEIGGKEDKYKLATHPIFCGFPSDIEEYAHAVLAKYELPRPSAPGHFWEDQNSGKLRWGAQIPDNIIASGVIEGEPVTGLFEPVASKFIDEHTDQKCWEAALASEYLDLVGLVDHERPRWTHETAHELGVEIGAILCEWRLGLIHGRGLLARAAILNGASASAKALNGAASLAAKARNDRVVASAKANCPGARTLIEAAVIVLKKLKAQGHEDPRALQTVAAVLSARRGEWQTPSTKPSTASAIRRGASKSD